MNPYISPQALPIHDPNKISKRSCLDETFKHPETSDPAELHRLPRTFSPFRNRKSLRMVRTSLVAILCLALERVDLPY